MCPLHDKAEMFSLQETELGPNEIEGLRFILRGPDPVIGRVEAVLH